MRDFAAIDLENANRHYSSICAIGVVVVRNGEVTDRYYSLVRPIPEYYERYNTRVHGLRKADTHQARPFPAVWAEVKPLIEGLPLVAHNKRSDELLLQAAFRRYRMTYPKFRFYCTYQAALKQLTGKTERFTLDAVASYCGHQMEHHHNALADAEACAMIALKLL